MAIDIVSVAHLIILVSLGIGGAILFTAGRYPSHIRKALVLFGHGKIIVGLGFAMLAFRDPAEIHWLAPITNGVVVAGVWLNYAAVRVLRRRPVAVWLTPAIGVVVTATCFGAMALTPDGLGGPRLISSIFVIALSLAVSYELLVVYRGPGRAHYLSGIIAAVVVVAMVARIVTAIAHGSELPGDGPIIDDAAERTAFLVTFLAMTIGAICFVLMAADEFNAELLGLARTDPLTGILNRRRFLEMAEVEFRRARRFRKPLTLLMLDIDHFKDINDTWGHAVGDRVLVELTVALARDLRDGDLLGRVGGEEFAVALLETDEISARAIAERLRRVAKGTRVVIEDGTALAVTVSIGGAGLTAEHVSLSNVVEGADQALYEAKNAGRDQVRFAPSSDRRLTLIEGASGA